MFSQIVVIITACTMMYGQEQGDSSAVRTVLLSPSEFVYQGSVIKDPWFSHDKFLHFSVSTALTGTGYYMSVVHLNTTDDQGQLMAVSAAVLCGLAKEVFDKKNTGYFSWKDIVWDGIGIAVGVLVLCRAH
jgi:uncharacterized protein YfiM (DUF2279 family)